MLQQVLSIRRTILHLTDHTNQFRMQTVHSQIDHGTLTGLYDLVFHLLLHLRYHLLDTSRMDTSVLYQLMQGQTSDLTANRIESGKNDSLRRIIHHDLNTGSGLQSTDITSLTTDDTAFDLVRFNMEHGNRVLDSRLRRYPLDRLDHDLLRLLISGHLRLLDDLVDVRSGLRLCLIL